MTLAADTDSSQGPHRGLVSGAVRVKWITPAPVGDTCVAPCGRRPTVAAMARNNTTFERMKARLLDPNAGAWPSADGFPLNIRRGPWAARAGRTRGRRCTFNNRLVMDSVDTSRRRRMAVRAPHRSKTLTRDPRVDMGRWSGLGAHVFTPRGSLRWVCDADSQPSCLIAPMEHTCRPSRDRREGLKQPATSSRQCGWKRPCLFVASAGLGKVVRRRCTGWGRSTPGRSWLHGRAQGTGEHDLGNPAVFSAPSG